jgi:hypothetical protein
MTRTIVIGLAAASLSLAALTPALADVSSCAKQPNADSCPTMGAPTVSGASELKAHKSIKHARYHPGQSPKQSKQSPYSG